MSIRYCLQRDNHSCGPVAVVNILKCLGYKATYKQVDELRELLLTCNKYGTEEEYILLYLRFYGILVHRVGKIEKGKVYFVLAKYEEDVGHYMVINGSKIINYASKKKGKFEHINRSNKVINKMFCDAMIWEIKE